MISPTSGLAMGYNYVPGQISPVPSVVAPTVAAVTTSSTEAANVLAPNQNVLLAQESRYL